MGVKDKLQNLMNEAGLNASQLAEKAKLPKSTVYALLKRDSANISYQTAQKLATALNCNESDILQLKGDDKNYFEELKRKISSLTNYLKELQSNNEYVEATIEDDAGQEIVIQESIYRDEISDIEKKLFELSLEIEHLLEERKISAKPTPYAEIINYYKLLNDVGRIEAIKRVEELTYIPEYKRGPKN